MELTKQLILSLFIIFLTMGGIFFAGFMLISKSTLHSVFYLILVFIMAALILLVFQLEFLALIYSIIYIGAILVLFLFVVMMLGDKEEEESIANPTINYSSTILILLTIKTLVKFVGIGIAYFLTNIFSNILFYKTFLAYLLTGIYSLIFTSYNKLVIVAFSLEKKLNLLSNYSLNETKWNLELYDNFKIYGTIFFTDFHIYFILGGFILLIAMIGSIILTLNYYDKDFKYHLVSQNKLF